MCYHYSLTKKQEEVLKMIQAEWEMPFEPVYHTTGFTFPVMPVMTQEEPGKVQAFTWGLIPPWVKSMAEAQKIRTQTLNARAETLWEKPAFRAAAANGRCIVLADGFFEWMEHNKKKYPHHIRLKSGEIFGFAGICNNWTDRETGELLRTFAIITTDANPFMARIHNTKQRMPVILQQAQWDRWIDPSLTREAAQEMLAPCPDDSLEAFTISRHLTTPGADTNIAGTIAPHHYPELHSGEQFSLFDR